MLADGELGGAQTSQLPLHSPPVVQADRPIARSLRGAKRKNATALAHGSPGAEEFSVSYAMLEGFKGARGNHSCVPTQSPHPRYQGPCLAAKHPVVGLLDIAFTFWGGLGGALLGVAWTTTGPLIGNSCCIQLHTSQHATSHYHVRSVQMTELDQYSLVAERLFCVCRGCLPYAKAEVVRPKGSRQKNKTIAPLCSCITHIEEKSIGYGLFAGYLFLRVFLFLKGSHAIFSWVSLNDTPIWVLPTILPTKPCPIQKLWFHLPDMG